MRAPKHSSRSAPLEPPPATDVRDAPPSRRRFRSLTSLAWYGLPTLIVVAVSLYIGLVMLWGVYPPLIPVEGASMRPTLVTGDLVFVHSVDPNILKAGQIIAVNVPAAAVDKYHLPSNIVHRIASIEHTPSGVMFTTKGDSNAGADVFTTPAGDVLGVVTGHLPYLGIPFLFFRGIQGQIFLGAVAAIVLIYMLMGWAETRKSRSADVLEALVLETRHLRGLLERDAETPVASLPERARSTAGSTARSTAGFTARGASRSRVRSRVLRRRPPNPPSRLDPPPTADPTRPLGLS